MRKDEFNELKIINEGENPDFEYGNTQDSESTSYQDNNDRLRDEINDNPTSNGSKRPYENKKKERKDKSEKDGSGKDSSHGGASVGTSVVTVAGASMIAVSTLSVLVGINIFFNAKFKMDRIEPTPTSISYELELTDIKNDECIIKLENKDFSDSKTLIEGPNSGEFTGLTPLTEYSITVIDLTYNNYVLYSDNITTTEEEVIPPLTTYTVTFVTNGGTEIPSQTVNEGDKVSKPTDPTREYHTFEGWYSDSDLTQEYDFNTPVTSDISIYAKWEIVTFTVTFHSNGGSSVESQTVNAGQTLMQPIEPEKTGYDFAGWYSDSGLTEIFMFTTPVYSDLDLYAKWEIITFNVEFVTNGGTEVPSQTVEYGATVEKPDDPTKENYTFKGWFSDSGLTEEYDFASPVTSELTLYADWEEVVPTTILFDANGGEGEQEPGYADIGEEFILPECTFTAPAGYAFDCWQLSGTEDKYEAGEGYLVESEGPLTFLAVWGEAATVEFYPGIGAQGSVTSIKVVLGKDYEIPSGEELFTPPEGKEFSYWFDDMNSVQRYEGDVITIEDNYYSFTASWKDLPSGTINFDANGGSGTMDPIKVPLGNSYDLPTASFTPPTGKIFDYWLDEENSKSYEAGDPITVTEDSYTLVAQWKDYVQDIAFDGFTLDYFDVDNTIILYSYDTYEDPNKALSDFVLTLDSSSGDSLEISFDSITGNKTIEMSQEEATFINGNYPNVITFTLEATDKYNNETETYGNGAVSPMNLDLAAFPATGNNNPNFRNYDEGYDSSLSDDTTVDMIVIDNKTYLPLKSDFSDTRHQYPDGLLFVTDYGDSQVEDTVKSCGGVFMVYIGEEVEDYTSINLLIKDPNNQDETLRSFNNLRLKTYSSPWLYGCSIDFDSFISSNGENVGIQIVCIEELSSLSLTIEPMELSGYTGTVDLLANIKETGEDGVIYFDLTSMTNFDVIYESLRRYPLNITLSGATISEPDATREILVNKVYCYR